MNSKDKVRIIVVGASAGGVDALRKLVQALPADLQAAILVVLHVPVSMPSRLPEILTAAGPLPATHAQDGEPITAGHIYVAPPDRHLLVKDGKICLWRGPQENHARPAVNPLFRTAAKTHGPEAVGVLLSGALDDGVMGLIALKKAGGRAIVQDPAEALFASMPREAIKHVAGLDYVLPISGIAALVTKLAAGAEPTHAEPTHAENAGNENRNAQ